MKTRCKRCDTLGNNNVDVYICLSPIARSSAQNASFPIALSLVKVGRLVGRIKKQRKGHEKKYWQINDNKFKQPLIVSSLWILKCNAKLSLKCVRGRGRRGWFRFQSHFQVYKKQIKLFNTKQKEVANEKRNFFQFFEKLGSVRPWETWHFGGDGLIRIGLKPYFCRLKVHKSIWT